MLEIGLGVLGFAPRDFWDMTYFEFTCAYNGYAKANGLVKAQSNVGSPWTSEDVRRVRSSMEDMMRRFPDGPKKIKDKK